MRTDLTYIRPPLKTINSGFNLSEKTDTAPEISDNIEFSAV